MWAVDRIVELLADEYDAKNIHEFIGEVKADNFVSELLSALEEVRDCKSEEENLCPECLVELETKYEYETSEYWGAVARTLVPVADICPSCREEY